MKTNRADFAAKLQSVRPGLASKEIIDQSTSFVFYNDKIYTFNDELYCSIDSPVSIEGAVSANELINLLEKLKEDEVDVSVEDGKIIIKGNNRRGGINLNSDIKLPIQSINENIEWDLLPEKFIPGLDIVRHCAGSDEAQFVLTCVHFNPEYIESCDNFQITRFDVDTELEFEDFLIRAEAIKNFINSGITHIGIDTNWVHFMNSHNLHIACRKYTEDYPDWASVLDCEGEEIVFPEGLIEAIEKAEIFSQDNLTSNTIRLTLTPGKIKIYGEGAKGFFEEECVCNYQGREINFNTSPKLMKDICEKMNVCYLDTNQFENDSNIGRLKIEGDDFDYVGCVALD